jgi:hypothetical protein
MEVDGFGERSKAATSDQVQNQSSHVKAPWIAVATGTPRKVESSRVCLLVKLSVRKLV